MRDKHGSVFVLHEVYLRTLTFGIGLLRFAVTSVATLPIQAVLDAQNSIMRLKNPEAAGRMDLLDKNGAVIGPFEPQQFITDVMGQFVGGEVFNTLVQYACFL